MQLGWVSINYICWASTRGTLVVVARVGLTLNWKFRHLCQLPKNWAESGTSKVKAIQPRSATNVIVSPWCERPPRPFTMIQFQSDVTSFWVSSVQYAWILDLAYFVSWNDYETKILLSPGFVLTAKSRRRRAGAADLSIAGPISRVRVGNASFLGGAHGFKGLRHETHQGYVTHNRLSGCHMSYLHPSKLCSTYLWFMCAARH